VELEPWTLLAGRYRITHELAQGGMGIVYRAYDERLDRLVAVKTVRRDDPDLLVRLRREARLLARLTHPNVVSLYDVGEHEGRPYIVTQLVDGSPLRGLLGRMTARRIAWVAEQVAHGLAAAHGVGIVHRDLKPSNVLVGDGTVRLLDFGIARHVDDRTPAGAEVKAILGTAAYISPEQLRGQPAGPEADVYALGLVLVECFSGRAAFGGTFAETVDRRLVERPELPESMPAGWHGLVAAMADPEPEHRPPAEVVASAMRALARTRTGTAVGAGTSAVDGRPVGDVLAAAREWSPARAADPSAPSSSGPASPSSWGDTVSSWLPIAVPEVLTRRAVVLPAAALVGFLLVVVLGNIVSPGGGTVVPVSTQSADAGPVATLPVTESAPTTDVLSSSVTSEPTTTVPPTVIAPPPPPPVVTEPPTTARTTPPTTESRRARLMREAREALRRLTTTTRPR
jgi:serine/threonine protein kinase